MRRLLAMPAAAALLLGACSYDFQNPAEELDSGEVSGRLLADLSGTGDLSPVAGVTVQLRNSGNVQSSRANGRFFMLGLVPGRHTLLFSDGGTWALQRDLELSWGNDGQPESILLGDLRLRRTVVMGGSFNLTVDGFQPVAPTAIVFDEATGAQATAVAETDGLGSYTGRFTYSFTGAAVGAHRLRFAVTAYQYGFPATFVGGPLTQEIPETSEGQSLTLTSPSLHPPVIGATGRLHFRVLKPAAAPMPAVVVSTAAFAASPLTGVPAPDSAGVFDWELDEGVYFVSLDLGAAAGGPYAAPSELQVVVVAGQTTDLGALDLVDTTLVLQVACLSAADCYSMESCSGGRCVSNVPACITGTFPECASWSATCFVTNGTTTPCAGGAGVCATGPFGDVCIPAGADACLPPVEPMPVQKPICGP
jgi:hypothetical protein